MLPATLASDVNHHIEKCPLCQMLLTDLQHIPQPAITTNERDRILRKLPHASPAIPAGWRWYAASAAAVILAVAGAFLFLREPQTNQPTQATTQPAETPVPQTSATGLQIAKLAVPIGLAPGLALRGEASTQQPTAAQLSPAFEAYAKDDYPLAAQRFTELADQFPRAELPFLYLGVTQLLQQEDTRALTTLTRADSLAQQNHSDQKDAASWYHALSAVAAKSPDAPHLLRVVCAHPQSPYSQQACKLSTLTP
ncbi:MAG TPA: hypothetical protein VIX90_13060 [Edaphobacter sp.]